MQSPNKMSKFRIFVIRFGAFEANIQCDVLDVLEF